MKRVILSMVVAGVIMFSKPLAAPHSNRTETPIKATNRVLSEVNYSLLDRYSNTYVNDVFVDNILLTLAYMSGTVKQGVQFSWDAVKSPGVHQFILKPGETFAFHDVAFDKYKGKVVATTNAHFNSNEGFKSDGWLVADGVCHLASFIYVASKEAGLFSEAPTAHDFAKIADVPKEYGVSIFYSPNNPSSSTLQNLYITNNRNKTIAFVFSHDKESLNIKVEELN